MEIMRLPSEPFFHIHGEHPEQPKIFNIEQLKSHEHRTPYQFL